MKIKQAWLNWRKLVVDDRDLSFGAKSIALYLNTYMNDSHDMAFPSIARICGELNISNKTAIKYLNELEEYTYLKKQKRFSNSTIYHAIIPSCVESTLMEDLHHRSVKSTPTEVENLHSNKQENKQSNNQVAIIPPEINETAWQEFEQHRKEIRQPLTELARTKAQNLIKGLSFEDQAKVIDNTIQNRWRGLFPQKINGYENSTRTSAESNHSRVVRQLAERIRDE